MKKLLLIFSVLLAPYLLEGQSSEQKSYLNGKEFFNRGQYNLAIEAFKPLTTYSNTFSEYATYFYALAAYRDGQVDIAKNILLQLLRKYPNWTRKDEAQLWLTKIYFEKQQPELALSSLKDIRDRSLVTLAGDLKQQHLTSLSLEQLKSLNKQFTDDKQLAEILAGKLAISSFDDDQRLFDELVSRFRFDRDALNSQHVAPTEMKERYQVAVCFPFMTSNIQTDGKPNSNQWVLDLYQGIQLGQSELKQQNIELDLFAYDTERDSLKTANILAKSEMSAMDLIIGPLYPTPSKLVAQFSFDQEINILNPLSSNIQIISNNPYSFLLNPGEETRAKVAASFISERLDKDQHVLVVYGSRSNDSVAAETYKRQLSEAGFTVEVMERIPTADAEGISRFIIEGFTEYFGTDETPLEHNFGHVFVASNQELIMANVIGILDNLSVEVSIMGNENWLRSRYVDYRQLERMNVYLTAPGFLDYTSDTFKEFQKKYLAKTGIAPNRFSFIGYESMLLYGKLLHQGGTHFQHELQKNDFYTGKLFKGYNYQEHNDNQYVPIVTFESGVLTQVNE